MAKDKHSASSTDKANKPKEERNYKEISWHQCQCSGSSQIPTQDDLNYHQFLSLYKFKEGDYRNKLIIYDTEKKKEEEKILDIDIHLDGKTIITQLPNGELFCYGGYSEHSATVIIDRSYRVRILPSGIDCLYSSALYFNNNIYCFGGCDEYYNELALSRKFDFEKNRWINLASFPAEEWNCHSVIFNRNILVSGRYSMNLWLYSTEIDSFSIIPYDFAPYKRKLMINVERLFLIEWDEWDEEGGMIYESEDEYHWKPISKSGKLCSSHQMYCLYNKEKIYISRGPCYYQFDLKKKVVREIKWILKCFL